MRFPFTKDTPKNTSRAIDFLAIGDTVVDDFIRLKDARVHCSIKDDSCEICMRWGDKIPFESSTVINGVGNSANAAVSAARLGLTSSLITNLGKDLRGEETIAAFKAEQIDTRFVTLEEGKATNYHYVLWFESERTILVNHEHYTYTFPEVSDQVKALYLSSLGEVPDTYYAAIAAFAESRPDMLFIFQPGTFQMEMGTERLAKIYARADVVFCNKEEAARILGLPGTPDMQTLLDGMRALGPKIAVITDGREGAYAKDAEHTYRVPMYPDVRPPFERTGAGDSFASTVTAALLLGKPLEEALRWGPVNSMSVVQEIGAQKGLLTREALEAYLEKAPPEYTIDIS